jgi:IMP dehydrogenase
VIVGLSFDDVLLEPKYSEIKSRSEIDIGSDLGDGLHFSIPIITAPMDTVTESGYGRLYGNERCPWHYSPIQFY